MYGSREQLDSYNLDFCASYSNFLDCLSMIEDEVNINFILGFVNGAHRWPSWGSQCISLCEANHLAFCSTGA